MSGTYEINGPTTVGDTGQLNTLLGDLRLTDITSDWGDLLYADATNYIVRLGAGSSGQILTTNGSGANPTWTTASGSVTGEGYGALKSGTQAGITGVAVVIDTWSTATPGFDNSSGDFTAADGTYVPSSTGIYMFNANVAYLQNSNKGARVLELVSGSTPLLTTVVQPTGNNSIQQKLTIDGAVFLNSGSTITLQVHSTGFAGNPPELTIQADPETWFTATRQQ